MAFSLAAAVSACGGGRGGDVGGDGGAPAPSDAARRAAADATAASPTNACATARPFYWEIGDARGARGSGSTDGVTYTAGTQMAIASASKWLYAAYVAERRGGAGLGATADVPFLNFSSGYTGFDGCLAGQTVAACQSYQGALIHNGGFSAADAGRFSYSGGHMQKHAVDLGLGTLDNAGLASELRSRLGTDIGLSYGQPQPAGGGVSTAADYARFLRKVIRGELRIGTLLGTRALCATDAACGRIGVESPAPANEVWRYSVGHWVEDDPTVGDGSFNSAGAFGFYPWINGARDTYGILARQGDLNSAIESVKCGRLIRKAWVTGVAQ